MDDMEQRKPVKNLSEKLRGMASSHSFLWRWEKMAQTYAAQDQEQQPVNEGLQGQPIHTSWENISFCFKLHLKIKACPNQKRNPIF